MNVDTKLLEAILGILGTILGYAVLAITPYFKGWLSAHTSQKASELIEWVGKMAYSWAEEYFKGQPGQQKQEEAITWCIQYLKTHYNLDITREEAVGAVQHAWQQYEGVVKSSLKVSQTMAQNILEPIVTTIPQPELGDPARPE